MALPPRDIGSTVNVVVDWSHWAYERRATRHLYLHWAYIPVVANPAVDVLFGVEVSVVVWIPMRPGETGTAGAAARAFHQVVDRRPVDPGHVCIVEIRAPAIASLQLRCAWPRVIVLWAPHPVKGAIDKVAAALTPSAACRPVTY